MQENKMMRAAASFFSGTMLSRITGMLRDMSMAFAFGTEASLAAFFVAFRFAHLLRRLLGEGTLQTAFIPHFEDLRKNENASKRAFQFYFDLYATLSLLLICTVILGMCTSAALYYDYFGNWGSATKEVAYLCFIMLPSLLFICLASLNCALLQCENNYFIASISPIAFNFIWIIGVLLVHNLQPLEAMPWLALFVVIACFFQWLFTLPNVFFILRHFNCSLWNFLQQFNLFSCDVRQLWKPLFLGIIGVGAAQINSALDGIFATYADYSGPAYLWFAIRLQQLPLALFGVALSGALLPPLTRAIAAKNESESRILFEVAIQKTTFLIVPMTLLLFLLGNRSIELLYGYGDFGHSSIQGTTYCLWGYGVGLIPMTFVLICAPAFYAKKNYLIPTSISVVSILINLLINVFFVFGMEWGAFSIALGTSLSAWLNMFLLGMFLEKSLRQILLLSIGKAFKKMGWVWILATFSTFAAATYIPHGNAFLTKMFSLGSLFTIFASFLLFHFCLFFHHEDESKIRI